jgi:hypothetical protein
MSKKHFELLAKYINSIMDPHARLQAAIAVARPAKKPINDLIRTVSFRPVISNHGQLGLGFLHGRYTW